MKRRTTLIAVALLVSACSPAKDPAETGHLSVNDFLGSAAPSGFERAIEPIAFEFPRDHGPHPDFRNEWWYLTGNLTGPDDRQFGFQFTIFRNALSPDRAEHPSRWATRQTYLAQIAITDVKGNAFYSDERFARGALGLSGVELEPFRVWLEDWALRGRTPAGCATCFSVDLAADSAEFGITLHLETARPPVPHGDSGLSRKGDTGDNASYYYSFTRLDTAGELRIGDARFAVSGTGWMDHEWSTSSLQEDQVGWDWFSLQFSDNSDLMLFQLRHRNDANRNFLYGTFVEPSGAANTVAARDIKITSTDTWTSPASGASYPAGWKIGIPGLDLDIDLEPMIDAQEMNLSFRYWEGAIRASGTRAGRRITGRGYVELTGY